MPYRRPWKPLGFGENRGKNKPSIDYTIMQIVGYIGVLSNYIQMPVTIEDETVYDHFEEVLRARGYDPLLPTKT